MKVQISKTLLLDLLKEIEDSARITHASYDRTTKNYPWNDAIWKKSDPHRFRMVQRARRALQRSASPRPDGDRP